MNFLKLPLALMLLSLIFASCQKEELPLDVDVTTQVKSLAIDGVNVLLEDGRLIFKSVDDADQVRSSIVNDVEKQSLLKELEGFTSSRSAFEAATDELSEATELSGVDAYSDIGLLIEDSGELSYEPVVDDPGLQYMANQEGLFQVAGDIYKIYRDFALVVPADIFFTRSEQELLDDQSFVRIPIRRSFIQKANLDVCDAEWREGGRRSRTRRVKGEIEHRTNIFNGGLTGIVRTKGQRRRTGVWFQYRLTEISQTGNLVVINTDGSTTSFNVSSSGFNQRDIVVEVFQCDGCPGFCGPFGVEHFGRTGNDSGTCLTQPPLQGSCF